MKKQILNNLIFGTCLCLTGCYYLPSRQGAEAQGKVAYAVCNSEDETYELFLTDVTLKLKETGSSWTKLPPAIEERPNLDVFHYKGGERLCDRIEPVSKGAEVTVKGVYDHNHDYFISKVTTQLSPEEKLVWPPGDLIPTVE